MKIQKAISLSLISLGIIFIGCNKNNNDPVPVFGNGTMNVATSSSATNVTGGVITTFRINLEAIRFRTIANDPLLPDNTIQIAPLVGPFGLVLMGTGTGSTIPSAPMPNATYDLLKFDLKRGTSIPMNNISILIEGTIGNKPFKMWHDMEPTWQKTLNNLVINGNALNFKINFVLDGLNLSGAIDGDANGTIEISPSDPDGNKTLADNIALHIKNNLAVTY